MIFGNEVSTLLKSASQAGTKLPIIEAQINETLAKLVDRMLQNNVTSVLLTEHQRAVGVINDIDIFERSVEEAK